MLAAEIAFITFGAISVLCSSLIVITGLVFPSIMLTSMHPFSNVLFIVALCDMLGSISVSFGYPKDGTDLCTTQAFMRIFFFPASWLWTTVLAYHMYCMIIYKKLFVTRETAHIICWSSAMCIVLIPLVQQQYGQDDDLNGKYTCFWSHNLDYFRGYGWIVGFFYGPLLLCVVSMLVCLYKVHVYINLFNEAEGIREKALYKSLFWYPIGMILCWILSFISYWTCFLSKSCSFQLLEVSDIIATQYGTLCAIVFFSGSKVVRDHWRTLLLSFLNYKDRNTSTVSSIRPSFLCDAIDIEDSTIYTNSIVANPSLYNNNNYHNSIIINNNIHNKNNDVNNNNNELNSIEIIDRTIQSNNNNIMESIDVICSPLQI